MEPMKAPRLDVKGVGGNQPAAELVPGDLTDKQKKRLAMKEKYKNRKSKSAGKPKPTGFEEFFAEAPVSLEDYRHASNIYCLDRPVLYRLQDALSKYQRNRRLVDERMTVFSHYLRYGGVDVGAKMFGGICERELKEMDNEEITTARSQTDISVDKLNLKVDFELVVKGFLSSYFPDYMQPESLKEVQMATATIKNWLNYLLYRRVVPEYEENIKSAGKYCDLAEKQLWSNRCLLLAGPGDFNKACSFLYGGHYFDPEAREGSTGSWEQGNHDIPSMTEEVAQKVMRFALVCTCTQDQSLSFTQSPKIAARLVEDIDGFEVTEVIPVDQKVRDFYSLHAPDLNPVGKLRGRAWRNPSAVRCDLMPGETLPNIDGLEFEFVVEETLLQHCYVGMKIDTAVWEMNFGVYFFDEIIAAYSSFYTVLWNDLMMGWKEPRYLKKKGEKEEEGKVKKDEAVAEESQDEE